jgi:hypothetical protein
VEAWATTRERSFQIVLDGREIRRVVLDPDELLPDVDADNNLWRSEQEEAEDAQAQDAPADTQASP